MLPKNYFSKIGIKVSILPFLASFRWWHVINTPPFIPVFNCEQITFYNLQIYYRWGNLMFESRDKDLGWNGKQNGVILNPGVYVYVMEYKLHNTDRKVKGGGVTLIR